MTRYKIDPTGMTKHFGTPADIAKGGTMPKLYRKKQLIEAEAWQPGIDMERVSVSPQDKEDGSPKTGDMIATDPENPKDRWLISADYFKRSYDPM